MEVSFLVRNTGGMDASECAQVYVGDLESSVPRPLKELKGSDKHFIRKGATERYKVVLGPDAFSFYDTVSKGFMLEPGGFSIFVGPSSADLPLKKTIEL